MGLFFFKWSKTAASNATADANVVWSEGQAPSTVNDSARSMMASLAGYRDDISGSIISTGTSTAYEVTSNQIFDSLSNMDFKVIAFTAHATNDASPTLNVDGLGAKPIVFASGAPIPAGTLILSTPYVLLYRNTFGTPSFVLQGGAGAPNAYSIPLGCGMDYWGSTAPSSLFAIPRGQAISRSTYSALFSLFGTTYGTGDGSTTFNLPDKSGRVSALIESSASRLTSSYFGGNSTVLGQAGGLESTTLTLAQLPTGITATGTFSLSSGNLIQSSSTTTGFSTGSGGVSTWNAFATGSSQTLVSPTASGTVTSNNTSGAAHRTVQPTIVCNYIIRVLTVLLTLHASVAIFHGWAA